MVRVHSGLPFSEPPRIFLEFEKIRKNTRQHNGFMHIQQVIIAVSICFAVTFAIVSQRVPGTGRRMVLLLAASGLFAVVGYEWYMSAVWEKTVSAPIRLDVLVIDFPIMGISIVAGTLAWLWKNVEP
ncbi:MAG: hypothetical protein QOD84_3157 [Acidobacteriaceae bacterium]